MAIETPKLKLLLIQEDWKFADDSFNLVISDMDNKLLGIAHGDSNVHWSGWQTGYSYSKGDIVRTESCKSNQYYLCVTNGISGVTEPANNITGSVVDDGTVQWKICILGDSEASAAVDIFRGGMAYNKGQLVLYNEVLYRCKVGHVAAMTMELDADKWQQVDASLQPWKKTVYFFENDIVVYDNVIYKCITAHTSGYTFDPTKWTPLSITLINDWQADTNYLANQIVLYDGILYRALDAHTSDATDFSTDLAVPHWEYICASIPEWKAEEGYLVGQVVLYNNRLYKCKTAHTATTTFEPTKWTQILATPIIDDWQVDTNYLEGQLVLNAGNLYRANQTHTSDSTSILPDISKWDLVYASVGIWDEAINYKVGQLVIYNNKLYKCNTNHLSTTTFDPTKFDAIVSFPVIEEWQADTRYLANQVVKFNNMLLIAVDTHTSDSTDIINDLTTPNIHWNLVYANIQTWQANIAYKVGTQVIYNNNLYQAKDTHTSGSTFDIAHWELIGQFDAFVYDWQANKYYYANQVVIKDKELYRSDSSHTSDSTWDDDKVNWTKISSAVVIDNWTDNTEYLLNEVVIWNGVLYRCNTAHTSTTTFDSAKFTPIYANVAPWQASTQYLVGQLVMYNNQLYKCITAHTSASTFEPDGAKWQPVANNIAGIPAWASGVYYYPNQVVKYDGKIWRCLTGHLSGNEEKPDYVKKYESNTHFLHYDDDWGIPLSDTPKDYTVDTGSIVKANKIFLKYSGGYIYVNASTKVSTDGTNFTTLDTTSYSNSGDKTINFYTDVRYIRVTANSAYNPTIGGGSLEFERLELWGISTKWEIIVDPDIKITYWSTNTNYDVGNVVLYNDEFYRCIKSNNSGSSFDSSNWKKIPKIVVPDWKANENYSVNQLVFYDGKLYKCILAHTSSSTFTQANWTPINDTIDDWATSKNYYVNQVVKYNNSLWRCKTQHLSATEKPEDNEIYTASGNIIDVDDTTTIPYNEVIDLGASYKIQKLEYTEVATDMSMKYYIEMSTDGTTYTDYEDNGTARYIRITVYEVDIDTGAVSPQAYLDSFKVYAYSDKWEEVSTMNTLTDSDIDEMFV